MMYLLFVLYRFVVWTSLYGLLINFQHLRTNVFLLQCLFGTITIPANLVGISILAIIFVPQGEKKIQGEERNDLLLFLGTYRLTYKIRTKHVLRIFLCG